MSGVTHRSDTDAFGMRYIECGACELRFSGMEANDRFKEHLEICSPPLDIEPPDPKIIGATEAPHVDCVERTQLTRREQFAMAAMQGLLSSSSGQWPTSGGDRSIIARLAINAADEVLIQLDSGVTQ